MKLKKILLLSTLVLGCSFLTAYGTWKTNGVEIIGVEAYTNGDGATYYNGISQSASGTTLLSALQSLNSSKRKKTVGYGSMWDYYDQTDPGSVAGTYSAFYRGTDAAKGKMNKEHVWPKSHGGNLVEGDIHMPRPTLSSDNSSRGNEFYVEGRTGSNGWDPYADGMEESYRGDSARIIFYCVVASPQLSLVDLDHHQTSNSNRDNMMGKLSDLLSWNIRYPVQNRERVRNEAAESIQGNRNPFIDHPEWACQIWGNYNENTKCACQNVVPPDPVEITSITLNTHELSLEEGNSYQLQATVTPINHTDTINWKSSNVGVVSVSSKGEITAVSKGNATITVSNSKNTISDTCEVTVSESSGGYTDEIHLNKTSLTLGVGGVFTLKAIDSDDVEVSGVEWSSTDETVATVENGRISAIKEGNCLIKATTEDNMTASCQLTVIDYSKPEEKTESGCSGSVLAPSVIVSISSVLDVALLLIKKYKTNKE